MSTAIDKTVIGGVIRAKREAAELTQGQLAARFGWNKQVISDLESGKAISVEKLMAVTKSLGVSMDGLRTVALRP